MTKVAMKNFQMAVNAKPGLSPICTKLELRENANAENAEHSSTLSQCFAAGMRIGIAPA
jgi:hypothetical protein